MPDRRVKGCPNENCSAYKKIKYKTSDDYCSKCGSQLVLVCSKCWTPLSVDDRKVHICDKCEAKAADRKQKVNDVVKHAGEVVIGVVPAVVAVVKSAPEVIEKLTDAEKKD